MVKRRNDPCSARRAKFGILPSAMNFVSRSGSRPSTPRIIIFLEPTAPLRACWQEKNRLRPAAHKVSRHTNQTRFLNGALTGRCKIWLGFPVNAFLASVSWLTMGGGHDITTRGNPEEQVHKLYAELQGRSRPEGLNKVV